MRRRDEVAAELDLFGINRIDRPDSLQDDSVRRGTTIAVVGLASIRSQIAERDAAHQQGIVAELLVAFGRERKHAFATPPSD